MYQPLVPCASCRRHVREGDGACPFCRALLGAVVREPLDLPVRLSRGGLIALASLAIAGCSNETTETKVAKDPITTPSAPPKPTPAPTPVPTPSDVDDHGTIGTKYGAPPPPAPTPKPHATPKPPPMAVPAYGAPPPMVPPAPKP